MTKRTTKRFDPTERIIAAERYGAEPFLSQARTQERRLVDRALRAKRTDDTFNDVGRLLLRKGTRDDRLLEKFVSLVQAGRVGRGAPWFAFAYDARVQRLLVRRAKHASARQLDWLVFDLALVGGPGALTIIQRHLRTLRAATEAAKSGRARRRLGQAYIDTAGALLRLHPGATGAAEVLLRAYRDPSRYGHPKNVVAFMRDAITRHPDSDTNALTRIRHRLRELLKPGADEDDLTDALPVLGLIDFERTIRCAEPALDSSSWVLRLMAAQFLSGAGRQNTYPALIRYFERHPDDWGIIDSARRIGSAVPVDIRCVIAEHAATAQHAFNRLRAAEYLRATPGPRAAKISAAAAKSEPEPLIAHLLAQRAASGRRPILDDT